MNRAVSLVGTAVALALPCARAAGQVTWHPTVAAGPADVPRGAVGHLGLRMAPGGAAGAWAQLRADATAGRLAGQPARAGTVALEVGPPEPLTRGLRLFGLLGATAVHTGPNRGTDRGLMAGAGVRGRLGGRVWLSAEGRFQPGFSPLLVGLSL